MVERDDSLPRIYRDWNDPMEYDQWGRLFIPCPAKSWDLKTPVELKDEMHALVGSGYGEDGEHCLECVIESYKGIFRARPVDPKKAKEWSEGWKETIIALGIRYSKERGNPNP